MMRKTAVEWLIDMLVKENEITLKGENYKLFEIAKQMEKEQIKDSFLKGYVDDLHQPLPDDYYDYNAEQYYNETYNKKT
jgi:hypothetical protein